MRAARVPAASQIRVLTGSARISVGSSKADSMELEFERRYLPRHLPALATAASVQRLEDFYLPEDPSVHPRLRLRRTGATGEITKKVRLSSEDAAVHTELTIPLEPTEFAALTQTLTRTVLKDRHHVELQGMQAQVDVFRGRLRGLVLIDFEFDTQEAMLAFAPPALCLAEVTQDEALAGGNLSGRTYQDIAPYLSASGYAPLIHPGHDQTA